MRARKSILVATAWLVVAGFSARAWAADDLKTQIRIASDSSASLADREKALVDAHAYARANKAKSDPLKDALGPLLKQLEAKRSDPAYGRLIELAFDAMAAFAPFPDVGSITRNYLSKDTPTKARVCALHAIEQNGATGVTKDLEAIFDEPAQRKDSDREALEMQVLLAAGALNGSETERVLDTICKKSHQRSVIVASVRAFGRVASSKPAAELDEALATKTLLEIASATNPDAELACEAAISLLAWDHWEGMAEVMKRAQADRKGGTRLTYTTVCRAAHKLPGGFNDVAPDKFGEATPGKRGEAIQACNLWWEKVKGGSTDKALFDALAAAGVTVAKDTSRESKDAIGTLIDGLSVPARTLRYACLTLLVKRTAQVDMARDFRVLVEELGPSTTVSLEEPPEGFAEGSARAVKLFEMQKERAKKWRAWWDKESGRVTLVKGVWKVP